MKRVSGICITLILLMVLSSCQQNNTIKNVTLTSDEQRIADLTSDIVRKFVFEKDKIYDIQLYLYQNDEIEISGVVYGIDTKGEDEIVLISGRKDGNVSFAWNFLSQGILKYPAVEIDDDREFIMVQGIGQDNIAMEESKEYVLVYAAFKEGTELEVSSTASFNVWDTIEDKTEALKEFTYAYVVTVKFSDSEGYK